MSKLSDSQKGFVYLYVFRKQMGCKLLKEVVGPYWSEENVAKSLRFIENSQKKKSEATTFESRFPQFQRIVEYSQRRLKINRIFEKLGIVRYVGISGSIAANIYKEGDDIDLFIVVANNWSWIYRGIIKFLLTVNGRVARNFNDSNVNKSLCLNFIIEERALANPESVFFMHEVVHVIPLYNRDYIGRMFSDNDWLKSFVDKFPNYTRSNPIFDFINFILSPVLFLVNNVAFLLQLFFMIFMNHKPEFSRLFRNHISGKIAFYPQKFRSEKEKVFEEMCKELFAKDAR